MCIRYIALSGLMVIGNILLTSVVYADGWRAASKAPNHTSVANTGHNLTQRYSDFESFMDNFRNDYNQVCVYCHTPHGASGQMSTIPLWNRTKPTDPYTLYSAPTTLGQVATAPGVNSLTCLSCHDGTIAIDSVINMPGANGYKQSQETSVDMTFLDSWSGAGPSGNHAVMFGTIGADCNNCHDATPTFPTLGMADFTTFYISTDLQNDHPIGIEYPTTFGSGIEFRVPTGTITGKMNFFDLNSNGSADKNEIRMYQTDGGYEVECASCHDPHGVPSSPTLGSKFIPSFLRVSNASSALCLTCHSK